MTVDSLQSFATAVFTNLMDNNSNTQNEGSSSSSSSNTPLLTSSGQFFLSKEEFDQMMQITKDLQKVENNNNGAANQENNEYIEKNSEAINQFFPFFVTLSQSGYTQEQVSIFSVIKGKKSLFEKENGNNEKQEQQPASLIDKIYQILLNSMQMSQMAMFSNENYNNNYGNYNDFGNYENFYGQEPRPYYNREKDEWAKERERQDAAFAEAQKRDAEKEKLKKQQEEAKRLAALKEEEEKKRIMEEVMRQQMEEEAKQKQEELKKNATKTRLSSYPKFIFNSKEEIPKESLSSVVNIKFRLPNGSSTEQLFFKVDTPITWIYDYLEVMKEINREKYQIIMQDSGKIQVLEDKEAYTLKDNGLDGENVKRAQLFIRERA